MNVIGPRHLGGTRVISGGSVSQMPSITVTYRAYPSMIRLILTLRLTNPGGQLLTVPPCPLKWHLKEMGPGDFGGTLGISGYPVSPNAVCCLYLQGTSSAYPAAFGPNAHRPPSSIQGRVATNAGTAFARRRRRAVRGDPGNSRRSSFTKCRPGSGVDGRIGPPTGCFWP